MARFLESIDHTDDRGRVKVSCGHKIDIRQIVYVHTKEGVTHMCPDYSKDLKNK